MTNVCEHIYRVGQKITACFTLTMKSYFVCARNRLMRSDVDTPSNGKMARCEALQQQQHQ